MRVMPAGGLRSLTRLITEIISRNRLFTVFLVVATLLRIGAEVGYRWQSWFNDSWEYVDTGVTLILDPTRTSGYSLYLALLRPFHSFALVTVSQHIMGLLTGVMIYVLARKRFSCPAWLATLLSLPVLLDGFEIQLEHLIMSDTLFLFLAMASIFVLLWAPLGKSGPGTRWWRTTWFRCALSGILIGLSALDRSTGVPLLPVIGLWIVLALVLARPGWKTAIASVAAFGVTALAPTIAYAGVYDLQQHELNTSESMGVFLYSRVMTFADCAKMGKLPVELLPLCDTTPPAQRPLAQQYIWQNTTPLDRFPGSKFSALPNSLAEKFAITAIEKQPLDYARAVYDDTARAFAWPRTVFPNAATYDEYLFGYKSVPVASGHKADGYPSSAEAYLAGGNPRTQLTEPFAGGMRVWQRYVWLPGTVYGLILLAGLGAVVLSWRRRDNEGNRGGNAGLASLLPWVTSVALVVVPAATAEFDYRYVTTAVPFGCLALAMGYAAARGRLSGSRPAVVTGTGGEAGGAASLPGGVTGGGLGDSAAEARDDERDLAPDPSRRSA